jgi:hypothetical protein
METAALIAWHKELAPAGETSVVFRDSAFADDVARTKCSEETNEPVLLLAEPSDEDEAP